LTEVSTPSFSKLSAINSSSLSTVLRAASKHYKNGKMDKAEDIYREILATFPGNKRAKKGLALVLNKSQTKNTQTLISNTTEQLIILYNQGKFQDIIDLEDALTQAHPHVYTVWSILGAANKNLGNIERAIEAFTNALKLEPQNSDGFVNLGNTYKDQGKYEDAIVAYETAITINHKNTKAYNNLGVTFREHGNYEKAIDALNHVIMLEPKNAMAFNNLGNVYRDLKLYQQAEENYNEAIELKENYATAYHNLGQNFYAQNKLDEAMDAYNQALMTQNNYAEVYNSIGMLLRDQNLFEHAIKAYQNAISLSPNYAVAHYNLGNLLKDRGDFDCAIKFYEKAISLNPQHAASFNNMGHALQELGKIDGSLENYIKAIELQPKFVEAHSNLAATWKEKGKLDEAIASAKRAISIQPDFAEAHMNLGFALLNKGLLIEGLDEYEWRWKTIDGQKRMRSFVRPWWNGKTPLDGKTILIWSEQGVGDTLNWSSRLSCISDLAENCILQCPEKLWPLLSRSFPNLKIEAVDKDYDLSRTDIDFHLPMGSIYRVSPPADANYDLRNTLLVPDPDRVAFWKERLRGIGAGPYIGLAWKSSNLAQRRMMNYASISDLSPVLQLPKATFVNLQYKDFYEDLREVKNKNGVTIHNFDDLDHFNNIDDVAALCAALDIVVTTKNTVSIIASRVGTTTKLANWCQSPWNNPLFNPIGPSVDIFERNTWESWERVFCEIANDISSSSYMKYNAGDHVSE
jgi:tetratricopeptide (TPR) repeat protein